jgi:hypothetical protein
MVENGREGLAIDVAEPTRRPEVDGSEPLVVL